MNALREADHLLESKPITNGYTFGEGFGKRWGVAGNSVSPAFRKNCEEELRKESNRRKHRALAPRWRGWRM